MRSIRIWRVIFMTMMTLAMIVACGGDGDDNENGSNQNVDGVNITTGKRLSELRLEYDESGIIPLIYKVEYDSKGRINKILFKKIEYNYDNETFYYTGDFSLIASIDYDLRVVNCYDPYRPDFSKIYGCVLNEDGYVSQIGTCTLNYDSNGYLVGVEQPKGIGTLTYTYNDLVKASVSNLVKGNITLFYVSYGNLEGQGDLFFNILRTDDKKREDKGWGNIINVILLRTTNLGITDIAYLIAYQSGLFGKVAKTFISLKSKRESTSLLDYKDNKYSYRLKMTFVCE